MTISATLCIGIGCYPQALYALMPFTNTYDPYTSGHVLAQLQLLLFSALAFLSLRIYKIYPPELRSANLDANWLYRRFVPHMIETISNRITAMDKAFRAASVGALTKGTLWLAGYHRQEGVLARTWPTGSMVLWVAIILGASLVMYFV